MHNINSFCYSKIKYFIEFKIMKKKSFPVFNIPRYLTI